METKTESKYERLRKIGTGSYGVVFKCINRQTGQIVAIKRYSENDSDPIIRKIAMREVRMLRQLRHPNLINLIEVFRRKRRLHLVFDYCELTVLDVIEKYGNNCPINLIKKIIWQTVNGINYCHTHNCIHRDIKPENILINQAGVVKLCDFGFARNFSAKPINQTTTPQAGKLLLRSGVNSAASKHLLERDNGGKENNQAVQQQVVASSTPNNAENQALTEYVATRWYRAPELLIGEVYYDIKIDIWAIGCVAAELMRGDPIWPGKTDLDQLCIIKNTLGQLTNGQMHTLLTQSIYDQASIERLLEQSPNLNESLDKKLPCRIGQNGIDFVSACLRMNPAKRPTSEELLKHIYIHSVRMTQFIKEANSPSLLAVSNNNQQLLVSSNNLASHKLSSNNNGVAGGGRLTTTSQLPTITKSRSNSQALKMATTTNRANSQEAHISSGSTAVLPARQPTKRLIVATTNQLDQQSHTTPAKSSSIPLAIAKTQLLNGINKLHHQQEQQQPARLQKALDDPKSTSPAKHKRKQSNKGHNRANLPDWN